MAYGLPWDAALAAMTIVPARLWGLADRYGTLERARTRTWWSGTPTRWRSPPFPEAVFIRGIQIPMESRHLELRDRYKDVGGTQPHAYRQK